MAWTCSANSNIKLLQNLKEVNIIHSDSVFNAMKGVDRKFYSSHPYMDSPQTIGFGATISAPHMHAYALEYLKIQPSDTVLDVGCGSGYLTACIAKMTSNKVTGVDHIPELVELAKKNVAKGNPELENIEFIVADGRHGYADNGPYDVIHVGAAANELHSELLDQLKEGGRLFLPVGKTYSSQQLLLVTKKGKEIHKEKLMNVMYVPLTDKENQY